MRIGILHTAFIGDVILSGLLVEALFVAGHEIIYFTKKNTCTIFSNDIRIKKVVVIQKNKGLKKLFVPKKIAKQIALEQCDVLLVPHRSATSTLSAYFSKVKVTVGFKNSALSFLYKRTVPFQKNAHECVRYLSLLNSFVDKSLLETYSKLARPVLKYSDISYSKFNEKFSSFKFTHPHLQEPIPFARVQDNFFILAVGSVWKTKKYLIEHWAEVAFQFLSVYPNYYCVLTGNSADINDIDKFISLFKEKCLSASTSNLVSKIVSAANLFSLFEFALFTSTAKLVLSNDSSPVHFASAFNIPVLTIFGPTAPEFGFAPSSNNHMVVSYADEKGQRLPCQPCSIHGKNVCPKVHFKCMKELMPSTIVKGIEVLLEKRSDNSKLNHK